MTEQQKRIINRQIGVLDGLAWISLMDEKYRCIAEALDVVTENLMNLLEEDEHEEDPDAV